MRNKYSHFLFACIENYNKFFMFALFFLLFQSFQTIPVLNDRLNSINNGTAINLELEFLKKSYTNPDEEGFEFSQTVRFFSILNGYLIGRVQKPENIISVVRKLENGEKELLKVSLFDSSTGLVLVRDAGANDLDIKTFNVGNENCKENGDIVFRSYGEGGIYIKSPSDTRITEGEEIGASGVLCGFSGKIPINREYLKMFLEFGKIHYLGYSLKLIQKKVELEYYKAKGNSAIIIDEVFRNNPLGMDLLPGDVVVEINGIKIQKISEENIYQVYSLLLGRKKGLANPGELNQLRIARQGTIQDVLYPVLPFNTNAGIIPENAEKGKPLYVKAGPFYFTEITGQFIQESRVGKNSNLIKLEYLYKNLRYKKHPEIDRYVVLYKISEKSPYSIEIETASILEQINGKKIRSLRHLLDMVQTNSTKPIVAEFGNGKFGVFQIQNTENIDTNLPGPFTSDN